MTKRRMISVDVYETDRFNDLPASAQSLYTHYILNADDDGLVKNPKMLCRMYGAREDDLETLIVKGYLIPFSDGVIAITHWSLMNRVRKDRYQPTIYQDDFQQLKITNEKIYMLNKSKKVSDLQSNDNQTMTNRKPSNSNHKPNKNQTVTNSNQMTANQQPMDDNGLPFGMTTAVHSIGQVSLGKASKDQVRSSSSDKKNTNSLLEKQGSSKIELPENESSNSKPQKNSKIKHHQYHTSDYVDDDDTLRLIFKKFINNKSPMIYTNKQAKQQASDLKSLINKVKDKDEIEIIVDKIIDNTTITDAPAYLIKSLQNLLVDKRKQKSPNQTNKYFSGNGKTVEIGTDWEKINRKSNLKQARNYLGLRDNEPFPEDYDGLNSQEILNKAWAESSKE